MRGRVWDIHPCSTTWWWWWYIRMYGFCNWVFLSLLVAGVRLDKRLRKRRKRNESKIWEESVPKRRGRLLHGVVPYAFLLTERRLYSSQVLTLKTIFIFLLPTTQRLAITDGAGVGNYATFFFIWFQINPKGRILVENCNSICYFSKKKKKRKSKATKGAVKRNEPYKKEMERE